MALNTTTTARWGVLTYGTFRWGQAQAPLTLVLSGATLSPVWQARTAPAPALKAGS